MKTFRFKRAYLAATLAFLTALTACGGAEAPSAGTGSAVNLSGVLLAGVGTPSAGLGVAGSFYLDSSSGRLFGPKATDAWPQASLSLAGPAGPVGAVGASGAAGAAGLPAPGLYSGATAPAPSFGKDGDFYLNTTDRSVTGPKANGVWPASGVSLVGLVGPAGATGATGATGPAGSTGAAGPAGTSLLSGSAQPGNAVGGNGDYFINTTTNTLFGPKTGGSWTSASMVSLVGPAGPAGGAIAPEIFACGSGVFTDVTPVSTATRTIFCDFGGTNPRAGGTRVNLALAAASTYASGTVITFRTTGTTSVSGALPPKGVP